jgi:glycosyltransferase 2 family protein
VLLASVALQGVDPKPRWLADVSRTLLAGAVVAVVVIGLLPHAGGWIDRILKIIPATAIRAFLARTAEQVLTGLRAFHDWRRMARFLALTAVVWTCDAVGMVSTARSLGLNISLRVAVLLLTGLALSSALPSTPGYIGIYQAVAVAILPLFGIDRDRAVAYIVLVQALGYVMLLAVGLPALYRMKMLESGRGSSAIAGG